MVGAVLTLAVATVAACTGATEDAARPATTPPTASTASATTTSGTPTPSTPRVTPPPVGAGVDYQLGGPSPVPAGVGVVVRDRTAPPPDGVYAVCYVNGFQAQPDEEDAWLRDHPDLVLRDAGGRPVVDEAWDELVLDTGTAAKRDGLLAVLRPQVEGCADDGYDAVELDNLDSWTRSGGRLTADDAVAMTALLAEVAHRVGLAVGQKNAAELLPRRDELGTDFAVVEECGAYDECDAFADAYGGRVLLVEYTRDGLAAACRTQARLRPALRDLDLVPAGEPGYVRAECP